jgi:predicted kinase
MSRGKLYFTVGAARCGKSTYCNRWVKEAPNRVIVCSDDIRKAISGDRFNSLTEGYVQAIKYTMIRAYLDRGFDVIADGTHTTEQHMYELLRIDNNAQYILIDTKKNICIQRAKDTNQSDLKHVIDRHFENMGLLPSLYGYEGCEYIDANAVNEKFTKAKTRALGWEPCKV